MQILNGLLNNILITVLSSILPFMVGVVFTILAKQKVFLKRGVKAASYIFECFVPIITMLFLFYNVSFLAKTTEIPRIVFCIAGFTISFLGYMSARYREDWSIIKNIIVNALNLVLTVFKWSFVASFIAVGDLTRQLMMITQRSFEGSILWLGLIIPFVILFIFHAIKYVLEEWMK